MSIAQDAIRFFALTPDEKISSWELAKERFRLPLLLTGPGGEIADHDYFFGVAAVFITYAMYVQDELSESGSDFFASFNHSLNSMMHHRDASDWCGNAVANGKSWVGLRVDAVRLMSALQISSEVTPVIDVGVLINSCDFLETEYLRRLLE